MFSLAKYKQSAIYINQQFKMYSNLFYVKVQYWTYYLVQVETKFNAA